jgi:hypothetical protein
MLGPRLSRVPRSSRFAVALALAALVLGAGIVAAANLVPNPGFETLCGALPCDWTAEVDTVEASSTTAHTGSRSVQVTSAGIGFSPTIRSGCMTGATSPFNQYDASFWCNTTDPDLVRNGLVATVPS